MRLLSIGQVAKKTNVTCDTIRLYEQYGLIDKPERAANGYRQYEEVTIDRLRFIIWAKEIGFTLKEIEGLLTVHQSAKQSCKEIMQQTKQKLQQVADKIEGLRSLEKSLNDLVHACEENKPNDLCPIFMMRTYSKSTGGDK
tara:strand:- start:471 stop:893 length:423 start_codon:yes stop_codon:yes gene_type:complete